MKGKMFKILLLLSLLANIACKEEAGLEPVASSAPTSAPASGNTASTLTLQGNGGN